jgi:hypothetical protein
MATSGKGAALEGVAGSSDMIENAAPTFEGAASREMCLQHGSRLSAHCCGVAIESAAVRWLSRDARVLGVTQGPFTKEGAAAFGRTSRCGSDLCVRVAIFCWCGDAQVLASGGLTTATGRPYVASAIQAMLAK